MSMIDRIAQDIWGILCKPEHAPALATLMAVNVNDSVEVLVEALAKDEAVKFAFGRISLADRINVALTLADYALAVRNATKTPLNGAEGGGEHQVDLKALESQNHPHNPTAAPPSGGELKPGKPYIPDVVRTFQVHYEE